MPFWKLKIPPAEVAKTPPEQKEEKTDPLGLTVVYQPEGEPEVECVNYVP
jgi:hypothetical protein